MVATDTLTFLLLGIHNSWDTVTYIALNHGRKPSSETEDQDRPRIVPTSAGLSQSTHAIIRTVP